MRLAEEPAWRKALVLWHRGAYWEVHEALEPLWVQARGLEREFLHGVILLAAALHKARTNPVGGRRNYAKALAHLAAVPDRFAGVRVRELEAEVHRALREPGYAPAFPTTPV